MYKDVKLLGSGAEATVKQAVVRETGQIVALKTMPKPELMPAGGKLGAKAASAESVRVREAFERDIRKRYVAMKRLGNHPRIPTYHELFEVTDKFYLILDVAPGGNLGQYLRRQGGIIEDEQLAARIASYILEGLVFVHSRGVIHRDLKPTNILLADDRVETLFLSDFSNAYVDPALYGTDMTGQLLTPMSPVTQSSDDSSEVMNKAFAKTVTGTPFYLAPEIVMAQPYTNSVDMWSAGCIIYEILFGRTPFATAARSMTELFNCIGSARINYPTEDREYGLSQQALSFLTRLLVRDPAGRMTAAEAMRHPWIAGVLQKGPAGSLEREQKAAGLAPVAAPMQLSVSPALRPTKLADPEAETSAPVAERRLSGVEVMWSMGELVPMLPTLQAPPSFP
ncbi:kinase-like domain-containing protein [Hyaloraphidium curvatum]|nr:kinase-like domain-containing protein [Hyaloraphidium curvatum]